LDTSRARAIEVLDILEATYPDARCALDFETPLQLLIATILAAQAQDKHINTVTPGLFRKYPTARAWAEADPDEVRADLKPTGFYNNKAKAVQGACRVLVDEHGGEVPDDLDALVRLPGVGRKTANVVLGNAFHHPDRVATDTHVLRLSLRLGWTTSTDPEQVERDLEALWPAERRTRACHLLQFHGRALCVARSPRCQQCPVAPLCPSAETTVDPATSAKAPKAARSKAKLAKVASVAKVGAKVKKVAKIRAKPRARGRGGDAS
jgi:endonuclease-3